MTSVRVLQRSCLFNPHSVRWWHLLHFEFVTGLICRLISVDNDSAFWTWLITLALNGLAYPHSKLYNIQSHRNLYSVRKNFRLIRRSNFFCLYTTKLRNFPKKIKTKQKLISFCYSAQKYQSIRTAKIGHTLNLFLIQTRELPILTNLKIRLLHHVKR